MDGVLVVDKERGPTSHDVVTRVRRALGIRRIGHIGTLDPMATGVLPLVIGRATRLASLLSTGPKVYEAVILLGVVTDTYDVTGTIASGSSTGAVPRLDVAQLHDAAQAFTGTYKQTPPPFSAKKRGGVRAYRLARQRQAVSLDPVEVTVHALDILGMDGVRLRCRVSCTPGFYMRALAHDLGTTLGCGACLEELRRIQSGAFDLRHDSGITLGELEHQPERARERLISLDRLLPELPHAIVGDGAARRVAHGNMVTRSQVEAITGEATAGPIRICDRSGALLAIAEPGPAGVLHPKIVLV